MRDQPTSARASIPTANASRYLQQLCKHWSHNLVVEFTSQEGRIVFPRDARGLSFPDAAVVALQAKEQALEVTVKASSPEQLEGLKDTLARHIDRFAFREAPLTFHWA